MYLTVGYDDRLILMFGLQFGLAQEQPSYMTFLWLYIRGGQTFWFRGHTVFENLTDRPAQKQTETNRP